MKDSGKIHFTEQTDRLGNSSGRGVSVTHFLVAIDGILGELKNRVDRSLFADDLAIYIITRSQIVESRALQGVANKLDAWAAERSLIFSTSK